MGVTKLQRFLLTEAKVLEAIVRPFTPAQARAAASRVKDITPAGSVESQRLEEVAGDLEAYAQYLEHLKKRERDEKKSG